MPSAGLWHTESVCKNQFVCSGSFAVVVIFFAIIAAAKESFGTFYGGRDARGWRGSWFMVYLLSPMPLFYDTRPLHESLGGGFRPLGAQCHPTKQVMDQHVPQHHRLDLLQPADDKLVKPAVAALGVGPFTFTTLFVFFFGLRGSHPLAPLGYLRSVAGLGSIRALRVP